MSEIKNNNLKLAQPAHLHQSPTHFDDATALRLSQAFGEQTDIRQLLRLLFTQMRALCSTSGLRFENRDANLDIELGQSAQHSAQYNLEFRNESIGVLTRYFVRSQNDQDIETGEDLIGLALTAIRNTVIMSRANPIANHEAQFSSAEQIALAEVATLDADEQAADTLVLVGLDHYQSIKSEDGEEWVDILMSSVHQQIKEGLRSADGVYHIGDDLVAVLLNKATITQAKLVTQKIRVLVASLHLKGNSVTDQLTACMGISTARDGESADQVMANAKHALAQARANGVNQEAVFEAK